MLVIVIYFHDTLEEILGMKVKMDYRKGIRPLLLLGLVFSSASYASFIETTMGTAVVNDATAAYFNPAALTLLPNSQIIPLATFARFRTTFNGQSTSLATGFTQSGSSNSATNYYSPTLYLGMPLNNKVTLGFAAVSNFANRDPEESSILRYVQASNIIQDYDFVPAIGFKINDYFAWGLGINFSFTNFHLQPIVGFPGSNIADSQGSNQSSGSGVGVNAGVLFRPRKSTLIGFDYRSVTTYNETGTSNLNNVTSNNYHFQMRTPARSILSISQMLNPLFGIITTLQYIQWDIIQNINVYNIVASNGTTTVITNGTIPQHLRNSWLFTFGGHYRFKPNWIIRAAGTYTQSPQNGNYQLTTGNSYVVGTSLGYQLNKTITFDASYAHVFAQDAHINIQGNRFIINGTNSGSRDAISLKLTLNV